MLNVKLLTFIFSRRRHMYTYSKDLSDHFDETVFEKTITVYVISVIDEDKGNAFVALSCEEDRF